MSVENQLALINNLSKQLQIARSEINNLRQQLKAATNTSRKEYEEVQQKLENFRCSQCRSNQIARDVAGSSSETQRDVQLPYIGIIHTHFPEKRGTPRQPGICPNMTAKLTLNNEVFTNPEHSLEGLQEYSHMWILFHFHKNEVSHVRAKVSPPRLNGIKTGVFATRSPHRPCPIGLSLVRIDRVLGNTVYFSGVDMVNETPVFDVKPYIPQYDNPNFVNSENFGSNDGNLNSDLELGNLSLRVVDGDGEENGESSSGFGDAVAIADVRRTVNEDIFQMRSSSRIGEREAPDGEEEEAPSQAQASSVVTSEVRVPQWVNQPPVAQLSVSFKDRALAQLQQLGSEGEEKKTIITNVLREDPRSVYLRERWGSQCYVFRIADLFVSCKFNQSNNSVTVSQVFQNSVPSVDE